MEKVTVKLIGEDGNIFSIMGRVKREMDRAGKREEAKKMYEEATKAGSYDEALRIIMDYVEVE